MDPNSVFRIRDEVIIYAIDRGYELCVYESHGLSVSTVKRNSERSEQKSSAEFKHDISATYALQPPQFHKQVAIQSMFEFLASPWELSYDATSCSSK